MTHNLESLGWTNDLTTDFEPHLAAGLLPGRVAVQHRGQYEVLAEAGDVRADVAGRMLHEAGTEAELPAVGDWVAFRRGPTTAPAVHAVLPRRTRSRARRRGWRRRSRCWRRTSTRCCSPPR